MLYDYASIHGRFQPFHLGHFCYLSAALECSSRVYIGLTRILTEHGTSSNFAPHRDQDTSNPLTYFERVEHIKAVLIVNNIDMTRIEIGPFPIENPDRLHEFWPIELPCLTTQISPWNDEKIRILQNVGYNVRILKIEGQEAFRSGSEIRKMVQEGNDNWRQFVAGGNHPSIFEQIERKVRR